MEKQVHPSAAVEDITVLSKEAAIDIAAGCETDTESQSALPVEHAIELSVNASAEAIAVGCQIDETSR